MSVKKLHVRLVKPFFDLVIAVLLMILLFPVLLLTSLILVFERKGRVFFVQDRIGLKGEVFRLYKFRTMSDAGEQSRFGKLLRLVSVDELPQLFNVLKQDMSLVGPRPLLVEYLDFYTEAEQQRHAVLPGITGLAQVKGRNKSTWESRMNNDIYYVRHVSITLDLKIMLLTVLQLFRLGQADFEGSNAETFSEYARKRSNIPS